MFSKITEGFGSPLPMEIQPMSQIMTTKEVARYLNLNVITIGKYAAQGRIPAVRIGNRWRFDKDAIDIWTGCDQNRTGGDEDTLSSTFMRPKG